MHDLKAEENQQTNDMSYVKAKSARIRTDKLSRKRWNEWKHCMNKYVPHNVQRATLQVNIDHGILQQTRHFNERNLRPKRQYEKVRGEREAHLLCLVN